MVSDIFKTAHFQTGAEAAELKHSEKKVAYLCNKISGSPNFYSAFSIYRLSTEHFRLKHYRAGATFLKFCFYLFIYLWTGISDPWSPPSV